MSDVDRVVHALRSGGPAAPASLHARIEALAAQAPPRRQRRPLTLAFAAVVAAAILLPVALSGGPGGTDIALARLATRPAQTAPPAIDIHKPDLLRGEFAGVVFPNWTSRFNWIAVGARSDRVGGRRTATVFYHHTHHTIAYTIVSGAPLKPPADARQARVGDVLIHRYKDGPRDAVMFVRDGRTCVLSGMVHDPMTLVKLAAWRGDNAPFS